MNPMHPLFVPLDADGAPARRSGRPFSSARTCGACHDVAMIEAHSDHWNDRVRADCVDCHFTGGRLPAADSAYDGEGRLRREALPLFSPAGDACASCHGIVQRGDEPLAIPEDFGRSTRPQRTDALTLQTGEILSGHNLSASLLNLRDKEQRAHPWDAHLKRLVTCVHCHYAQNNPQRAGPKQTAPGFLADDPRTLDYTEYLKRPDHRLAAAECQSCHDPDQAHGFLPYRARHLAALDCRACHVPELFGPAARLVDSTVVTADSAPAVILRGTTARPGEALNTAYIEGYSPILRATRVDGGRERLAPYNAVSTYAWRDATGAAVPWSTVTAAFLKDCGYAPEVVRILDADGDGHVSPIELRLDTAAKAEAIAARLRGLGVAGPVPASAVRTYPIRHGVQSGKRVLRDCNACHTSEGRWSRPLELAPYSLAGMPPAGPAEPTPAATMHIFGHARGGWSDRAGYLLFFAGLVGVAIHAFLRLRSAARRTTEAAAPRKRVYLYSRYDRLWHWLMAGSVLVLIVTGLVIHFSGTIRWLPLPWAVQLHNIFAVVLAVNGFLSLFYHVTTNAIRRYFLKRERMLEGFLAQARFYTSGIFLGRPHPSPKTAERRLNPLQQLTYLMLLNLLFPLQLATGILIWGASRWPDFAERLGGLTLVAPIHNFGAGLFSAFLVMHIYLTTTGHTPTSNIKAMVGGYDEIEVDHLEQPGGSHA